MGYPGARLGIRRPTRRCADIAEQLKIDEKTLRKHFRDELSSGKFKVDMTAGKTLVGSLDSCGAAVA
jgi:hypothetical protein